MSRRFTKKHYEDVAKAMKKSLPAQSERVRMYQWRHCRDCLALMFLDDADEFDMPRFLVACGDSVGVDLPSGVGHD